VNNQRKLIGAPKSRLHSVGAKLSGIGVMCARQRPLLVPTDENACSKTINDNNNTTTEVIRLTCPPPHIPFDDFYIFHQVCWEQLSSHFDPEELDLDRLYAALQYMPVPKR
jgi:hypothetical protein